MMTLISLITGSSASKMTHSSMLKGSFVFYILLMSTGLVFNRSFKMATNMAGLLR
jgi:hypothetical protein